MVELGFDVCHTVFNMILADLCKFICSGCLPTLRSSSKGNVLGLASFRQVKAYFFRSFFALSTLATSFLAFGAGSPDRCFSVIHTVVD